MADIRFVTKEDLLAVVQQAKLKYTNQDAISKIKIGQTILAANEAEDQIELIEGDNIAISVSGDTITIAATDTTYDVATASVDGQGGTNGLFTGVEKEKLAGIADGAEVNQYAYSGIKYGSDVISAATKQDTFEFAAGTNVTITADAVGKKLTFAATDTTYADVVADSTGAADSGLMTSDDKAKLDGVEDGAQENVVETVKVNGTALTPDANKAVDVTIVTGDAGVGTIKVNGSSVGVYGLGTAAAEDVETVGIASNTGTLATTAQVKSYVDGVVSSTYKPAGAIAPASVTSSVLVAANEGKVYNLSAALTLDATTAPLFVDGTAGESFPEGTNIVVIEDGNGYKFDVLAGFVDLSGYVLATDLGGLTTTELNEIIAEL